MMLQTTLKNASIKKYLLTCGVLFSQETLFIHFLFSGCSIKLVYPLSFEWVLHISVIAEDMTWREGLSRLRDMGLGIGQVLGRKGHMPMERRQQGLHYNELVEGLGGKRR